MKDGHLIQQRVQAVQSRLRRQWLWECGATGLFAGGAVGCLAAIVRILTDGAFSWIWVILAVAVPAMAGVVVALVRSGSLSSAARLIDSTCHLKDRTQTALQFLQSPPDGSAIQRLQIEDAESHLQSLDPAQVSPIRAPKLWGWSVVLSAVAVMLAFVSGTTRPAMASAVTNPVVAEQASRTAEGLEELERLQTEQHDPELEKMLQELNMHLQELRKPGVEPKEALAKLSEMEAALQEMQKQLKDPSTEAQLKEIGDALSLAEEMAAAGQAMAKGELDKAAAELAKSEMPELDRKTQKAVTEKLDQVRNSDRAGAQKETLQQAVDKIREGLSSGDKGKFQEGAKGLASECQQQAQKKKLADLLQQQVRGLAESKSQCEAEARNLAQGGRKGGQKAGKGSAGDPAGEKTAKLSSGREMKLEGQESGTGDMETETTTDPGQEQEAVRQYRQNAGKYEAISESVLESESIPLGHRQTIRRYFEMIRPKGPESDAGSQDKPAPSR